MTDIRKSLNVFTTSVEVGQIAEISAAGPSSQTVKLVTGSVATLVPGRPVKLVTGAGNVPLVELAVPGTDDIYGLVLFNPKVASWVENYILQVSGKDTVLYLAASESLARGAQVGLNTSTYKLIAATQTNYIGRLLDEATNDAVVRVQLDVPLGASLASA